MGHIKEPLGVDFVVDPTPLSNEERRRISEIIAHYKATGQKIPIKKSASRLRVKSSLKKKQLA